MENSRFWRRRDGKDGAAITVTLTPQNKSIYGGYSWTFLEASTTTVGCESLESPFREGKTRDLEETKKKKEKIKSSNKDPQEKLKGGGGGGW